MQMGDRRKAMFDPHQRRIATKQLVWDRIQMGELMTMTLDTETSGVGRSGVPYQTPGSAFVTEIGDVVTDFAGNYLNGSSLYLRRPEWLVPEVTATLIQRVQEMGPELFDDPNRIPFWLGMAAFAWRQEQTAFAYPQIAEILGDKARSIAFTDFNKQFKNKQKPGSELVYDIPLLDAETGEIVYDVRYHPDRRKVAYRFHRDGTNWRSKQFMEEDNLHYRDEEDGSLWKWVEPGVRFHAFNADFDVKVLEANLQRAGFTSNNSKFMRQRATALSKQRKKNHVLDVKDRAYLVARFGPQDENGLKLGQMMSEDGMHARPSEALIEYMKANSHLGNPFRMIGNGALNIADGSFADDKLNHGAFVDCLLTAGLDNKAWDAAPEIAAMADTTIDERAILEMVNATSPHGTHLPFFVMPRKEAGKYHSDLPYWFLGTDDQIGRFKGMIYLRADGSLHRLEYNGKLLKDLTTDEFTDFVRSQLKKPKAERYILIEPVKKHQPLMPLKDVLSRTSAADRYWDKTDEMVRDMRYLAENTFIKESVINALGVINHERRFRTHSPQNEFSEDAMLRRNAGEIAFHDSEIEIERRMMAEKTGRSGPQAIPGILQTIKNGMDNDYKYFYQPMDEALGQLCVVPHPVDNTSDKKKSWSAVLGQNEDEALESFKELAERIYKKAKEKKWPLKDILDGFVWRRGIMRYLPKESERLRGMTPQEREQESVELIFLGGKINLKSAWVAQKFRFYLGRYVLNTYDKLITDNNIGGLKRDFIERGVVDTRLAFETHRGPPLLMFFDVDNGQSGNMPHVIDDAGREISIEILKGLNDHIDFTSANPQAARNVIDNLVNTRKWRYRFYKDPSEPSLDALVKRFVNLGYEDKLPESLRAIYDAEFVNRMKGFENETVTTARAHNLRTMQWDMARIKIAATSDPLISERSPDSRFNAAVDALAHEEGQQLMMYLERWKEKQWELVAQKDEQSIIRQTDPVMGLSFDYIKHEIQRDSSKTMEEDKGFSILDLPVWHMRNPVEQSDNRYARRAFIIPEKSVSTYLMNIVNYRNRKVLVRGIEDGRLAAVGPADFRIPMPDDAMVEFLRDKARTDYGNAGIEFEKNERFVMLGIEDIYPLAGTRSIDFSLQSFKLPHNHFDGLTNAFAYAGFDRPLTAVLMPVDYCPQVLKPGERIRLRQMSEKMFSNIKGETDKSDTGHSYETVLSRVIGLDETGHKRGLTVEEITDHVQRGSISPDFIKAAGFGGIDHLRAVKDDWVTEKWKGNEREQRFVLAEFERVNADYFDNGRREADNSYSYAPLGHAPSAAMSWDFAPVSPNMYNNATVVVMHRDEGGLRFSKE